MALCKSTCMMLLWTASVWCYAGQRLHGAVVASIRAVKLQKALHSAGWTASTTSCHQQHSCGAVTDSVYAVLLWAASYVVLLWAASARCCD